MGRRNDAPRTRAYALSALLIAAVGVIFCWDDPMPRLKPGVMPQKSVTIRKPLTASIPAAEVHQEASVPEPQAQGEGDSSISTEGENLHDAVASPVALNPGGWYLASARGPASLGGGAKIPAIAYKKAASFYSSYSAPAPRPAAGPKERPQAAKTRQRAFSAFAASTAWRAPSGGTASAKLRPPETPRAAFHPGSRAVVDRIRMRGPEAVLVHREASPALGVHRAAAAGRESTGQRSPAAASKEEPKEKTKKTAHGAAKIHPALLSRELGHGTLKPPLGAPSKPHANPWSKPIPQTLEDGRPIAAAGASLSDLESAAPPPKDLSSCRIAGPHWHDENGVHYFHEGQVWGRWEDGRWAWLEHEGGRWWAWGKPQDPPLLWHQGHWWWQSRGAWFLLHEGQPWGYRYLGEHEQEGLVNADGVEMVYSADGSRIGVVTPGQGAILYDAQSGAELGRFGPNQLPKRRSPRAPSSLKLPR